MFVCEREGGWETKYEQYNDKSGSENNKYSFSNKLWRNGAEAATAIAFIVISDAHACIA